MTKELKPCPFCGGQAVMKIQKHIPSGYDYTPTCQDSSCAGRLTKKWTNEAVAIEAWNKRKSGNAEEKLKAFWDGMSAEMKEERTAKVEKRFMLVTGGMGDTLPLCECGFIVSDKWTYCPACGCKLIWGDDDE